MKNVLCNVMEWNGMEWNGMEWNGIESITWGQNDAQDSISR